MLPATRTRTEKVSEYGLQLREKQKLRRIYDLRGSVCPVLYQAEQKKDYSENLLRILESRLDNIVYRLNLAASRSGQQMVRHGFKVNGKS